MTTDTRDRYGVTDGGKPIKVIVPSFSVKAIGQSTPVAAANNTLTFTLKCDTSLIPGGSMITITGLTGTQTLTSISLNVVPVPNDGSIPTEGHWSVEGTLQSNSFARHQVKLFLQRRIWSAGSHAKRKTFCMSTG
jgi:hypothetical protein